MVAQLSQQKNNSLTNKQAIIFKNKRIKSSIQLLLGRRYGLGSEVNALDSPIDCFSMLQFYVYNCYNWSFFSVEDKYPVRNYVELYLKNKLAAMGRLLELFSNEFNEVDIAMTDFGDILWINAIEDSGHITVGINCGNDNVLITNEKIGCQPVALHFYEDVFRVFRDPKNGEG